MKHVLAITALAITMAACTSNAAKEKELEMQAMQKRTEDSLRMVQVKQRTQDSLKLVEAKRVEVRRLEASSNSSNAANEAPATVEEKKKKGWSPTAQGAVIGGVTGAVAGAIIDKKAGRGAIIGGVVGAGAGAVTGNAISKNKKKKAAQQ